MTAEAADTGGRPVADAAGDGPAGGHGWIRADRQGKRWVLAVGGRWDIASAGALDRELRALEAPAGASEAAIDLGLVKALDTTGAWLLRRTGDELSGKGLKVGYVHAKAAHEALLRDVRRTEKNAPIALPGPPKIVEIVNRVGRTVFDLGAEARNLIGFFGMLIVKTAGVLVRPARFPLTSMVYHMEQTGLNAMPIVALLSFLIGVVMAYQGALQLQRFGAELFVVNLLGVSILRELGILITAIVIAGRSGSAFTAQIGTMKVNQEVDAMATIGIDPIERLVLPRVLALMITLPMLAFMSDIVALVGGALMSYFVLDISVGQFMAQLLSAVDISHLWVGLIKAPVFAFTIAMCGCYEGLKVVGSAESVGRQTTKSVVESIFLVIVLDALFSILFANLGY